MIFLDVLLSLNLLMFGIWAVRSPRRGRPGIDQLVAAAVDRAPVDEQGGVLVAFPTREELDRRRARSHHPSMYGVSLGQPTRDGRFSSRS
jgi:hypothetical protein